MAPAGHEGRSVWYVMARDQRVTVNHALAYAQQLAQQRDLPLGVIFCLQPISLAVSREQYDFMLRGLAEVEATLAALQIPLVVLIGSPRTTLAALAHHTQPSAVVFDMSPLRGSRRVHDWFAATQSADVYEVDAHNIVPVWDAYPKAAYGARILRPHVRRLAPDYLELPRLAQHARPWPGTVMSLDTLCPLIDEMVQPMVSSGVSQHYESGEAAAHSALDAFIAQRLRNFARDRNDPSQAGLSGLSPYLHFGQLYSAEVIMAAQQAVADDESLREGYDALFEEMVVRKELSDNFCWYTAAYNQLDGAANWAKLTLAAHADDPREITYRFEQLRDARTHDQAWNAAQRQLRATGKIHGYMRMYWAKKVLEWSPRQSSPDASLPAEVCPSGDAWYGAEWAIAVLVYLNDFYSLDGRDPNGYVGILWSVAGVHDRPWATRAVYGSIRTMTAGGLRRKFDIDRYIALWT